MSEGTFYNWKAKYGGMDVSEAKRLKGLEDENAKPEEAAGRGDAGQYGDEGSGFKNVWSAPLLQGFRAWPSGLRKCIRPLTSQPLLAARP